MRLQSGGLIGCGPGPGIGMGMGVMLGQSTWHSRPGTVELGQSHGMRPGPPTHCPGEVPFTYSAKTDSCRTTTHNTTGNAPPTMGGLPAALGGVRATLRGLPGLLPARLGPRARASGLALQLALLRPPTVLLQEPLHRGAHRLGLALLLRGFVRHRLRPRRSSRCLKDSVGPPSARPWLRRPPPSGSRRRGAGSRRPSGCPGARCRSARRCLGRTR